MQMMAQNSDLVVDVVAKCCCVSRFVERVRASVRPAV